MEKVQITIIGAGVVGLAIAETLSHHYDDILVLEQHDSFGQETSSRNSEVIHSGIYYPNGSLKHQLCIKGNQMLYDYCVKNNVAHQKVEKLIVATTESEKDALEKLYQNGVKNEVPGLSIIDQQQCQTLAPNITAVAAIHSPETGIVDSHALMKSLMVNAEKNEAMVCFNTKVTAIKKVDDGYQITTDEMDLVSEIVINCAGLSCVEVSNLIGCNSYQLYPCKGDYFSFQLGKHGIKKLIYPVPMKNTVGLGVHATLDLAGQLRFGPDAAYIDTLNYDVDPSKKEAFYTAIKTYFPDIKMENLQPDFSGIRPKTQGPSDPAKDFIITDEKEKGYPGFINCIGIESPGLTSCLAIAAYIQKEVLA